MLRQAGHVLQGTVTLKYRLNEDLDLAEIQPPATGKFW
jgi:hypothetical protein